MHPYPIVVFKAINDDDDGKQHTTTTSINLANYLIILSLRYETMMMF